MSADGGAAEVANPYDGTAAVVVPQAVEKLPLLRWKPGARALCVGSRRGAVFAPDLDQEEATTYRRTLDVAMLATAAAKMHVDAVAATWCESLRFPAALDLLRQATELPLIVASGGGGPDRGLDTLLAEAAAWSLLVDRTPGAQAARILAEGRHVEILLGLDAEVTIPDLPWAAAAAIHLVPRDPAADPEARRSWYQRARAALPTQVAIHDEDHQHSDCICGERLVWRHGGRSRADALGGDGRCMACAAPSGFVL